MGWVGLPVSECFLSLLCDNNKTTMAKVTTGKAAATSSVGVVDTTTPPSINDLPESIDQASNNQTWGVNRNEDGKIYWYRYDPYKRLTTAPLPSNWTTMIYQDALTGLTFPWYVDSQTGRKQWSFPSDDVLGVSSGGSEQQPQKPRHDSNNLDDFEEKQAFTGKQPVALKLVPSKIKLVPNGNESSSSSSKASGGRPVSYTHLTLPTIYSV